MFPASSSLTLLLQEFIKLKVGSLGVHDDKGTLIGIVSERDIILRTDPDEFERWDEIEISSIMSERVFFIEADKKLSDAVRMMGRMEFRHLPVKSNDSYTMISARDILDLVIEHYQKVCDEFGTLEEWEINTGQIHEEANLFLNKSDTLETGTFLYAAMKEVGGSNILKVDEGLPVKELWQQMKKANLSVAAVASWSTLVKGIITERDFITKVFSVGKEKLSLPVSSIMTVDPHTMMLKHHIVYALNNMAQFRYRNILVVDEDKFPIKMAELIYFLRFFDRILSNLNPTSAV